MCDKSSLSPQRDCVVLFVLVFLLEKGALTEAAPHDVRTCTYVLRFGLEGRISSVGPFCALVSEVSQSIGLSQCCPSLLGWALV